MFLYHDEDNPEEKGLIHRNHLRNAPFPPAPYRGPA
jgi:hypothetical protein